MSPIYSSFSSTSQHLMISSGNEKEKKKAEATIELFMGLSPTSNNQLPWNANNIASILIITTIIISKNSNCSSLLGATRAAAAAAEGVKEEEVQ